MRGWLWLPILYLLVLPFRPAKTARKYAMIWKADGSPLRIYHERQAQLLRGYLGERLKAPVPAFAAMRYGKPAIADGLEELAARGCDRVLVMPMYPQYASSATGSVEDALAKALRRMRPAPEIRIIRDFHAHRAYAKAIAKNVNDYWFKHGRPDRLVMSFHGVPKASIDAGDPYQAQCLESARLIKSSSVRTFVIGRSGSSWRNCSRIAATMVSGGVLVCTASMNTLVQPSRRY